MPVAAAQLSPILPEIQLAPGSREGEYRVFAPDREKGSKDDTNGTSIASVCRLTVPRASGGDLETMGTARSPFVLSRDRVGTGN